MYLICHFIADYSRSLLSLYICEICNKGGGAVYSVINWGDKSFTVISFRFHVIWDLIIQWGRCFWIVRYGRRILTTLNTDNVNFRVCILRRKMLSNTHKFASELFCFYKSYLINLICTKVRLAKICQPQWTSLAVKNSAVTLLGYYKKLYLYEQLQFNE